ncbi:hypothetical protein BO83DRAFT_31200 [Aspergillus eucalypticola CBS 122712]|uniref:Uncharacterized protein n=1 Tax=Aspergillus eucalypticola (strain CBS 122712 / IBT 29274) TaxID=1448314 RepID=A0A317VJW1_ASPEC|nr:uncharacterized protein BO83DRAFT_31200 [Aspergillus eucalypticola CBS 122712]PWY73298.1 hypothetical protein BO83DRAFT_31200 [Aspergillus eucalypticola CBS 122712]
MTPRKRNAKPCPHKKTTTTERLDRRSTTSSSPVHTLSSPSRQVFKIATRVSAPSRSLPKLRDRTVLSPSGFVSGPVTPSDTTPSVGTGASPVSESKFVHWRNLPHQPTFSIPPREMSLSTCCYFPGGKCFVQLL